DVDPATVFSAAERWFGPIAAAPLPDRAPLPAPVAKPQPSVAMTGESPYTVVDLAYRIPGDLDAGAAATQLFANLVNNERSTFYKALVESKLTLGYNAYADTALHQGAFHVILNVTPGVTPQAARAAFEGALAHVRTNGVDPALLTAAKTAYARQ